MFLELAAVGFLVGNWIYHRLTDEKPEPPVPQLPTVEDGAPVPMLFGRCRVTAPVLVWAGDATYESTVFGTTLRMDLYFVLGLGFQYGHVVNRIHSLWAEDTLVTATPALSTLTGEGSHEDPAALFYNVNGEDLSPGDCEFLNGNLDQELVNVGGKTYVGDKMIDSGLSENVIPGYRNVLSAALLYRPSPFGFFHSGQSPSAYHFEASSYYEQVGAQPLGLYSVVGQDANPMTVIYEVLTAQLGKLGLPTSMIDLPNFEAAAYTLYTEPLGYSRWFSERTPAADIIRDVLRTIDGMLYLDPVTSKIKVKLIRADFDPNTIPQINKNNAVKITGFAMGGRSNLINKVVIKFPNRDKEYNEDSTTAQNMANAVGQSGQVAEEAIEYRGICDAAMAQRLAERELGIRSKPQVKCRAICGRWAADLRPGDPVYVVWTGPDLNAVFRVVGVDQGTLEDGAVGVDLILDANYIHRRQMPLPPDFGGIDLGSGGILVGG